MVLSVIPGEVVGVGEDYVDLSKTSCDEGSVAPQEGDNLVQFGHKNDATRQNAIIIGSGNTPRIYQYVGIGLFNIPEPQTKIEPNNNQFSGIVKFKAGSSGGREHSRFATGGTGCCKWLGVWKGEFAP